jgi:hypothetical protein
MSTIINGTSSAITFPDSSVQNTSAIVSGYVPYANLPAGSVLQVVNANTTTQTVISTSTYTDTTLTATITPKFATSKILVIVDQNGCYNSATAAGLSLQLLRNSTPIIFFGIRVAGDTGGSPTLSVGSNSTNYLDSPATTSAITYKTQFSSASNTSGVIVQVYSSMSTITLMEIAA